ncbi:fasciclin domain-containing protein [Marinobacterium sediminicola]|uniref:Fasciclin domain-containing protein n=1 Tax=Marinobacterium sediminicola TaxID=518898 RepID=A0ABY1RWN8_9GAMM|nr:fasciclin domain-containing protein [Marinobacterium sediminicola]ULG70287.1 fasciclin domain-containing protein [Marinobacterium sediminicola]SMR69850.1 Fasciclin domain-containing protein [Marinobacterium sediminicola]
MKITTRVLAITAFMALPLTASAEGPKDINSLVDTAVSVNSEGPFAGEFDTLITLLTQDTGNRAAILSTLDSKGQHTVFAPTDSAFEALQQTALTLGYCSLNDLDPYIIDVVLLYHVAHGRLYASDVLDAERVRMLTGGFLMHESAVLTDNLGRTANLIPGALDVEADNGVIHAIDAVVLPVLPDLGPGNCS